jgi:hypothetical protein
MTVHVLNARTLAVSTYSLAPLDVVEHEGDVYFVTETELSKLTTGTAAFTTIVETGMISLGADEKKFVPNFLSTLSGDSTTEVTMTIELDGREVEMGPYELPGRSGAASFVRKWKMAGGVKADSMSLKFEGTDGTAWKLSGLTVQAELL